MTPFTTMRSSYNIVQQQILTRLWYGYSACESPSAVLKDTKLTSIFPILSRNQIPLIRSSLMGRLSTALCSQLDKFIDGNMDQICRDLIYVSKMHQIVCKS